MNQAQDDIARLPVTHYTIAPDGSLMPQTGAEPEGTPAYGVCGDGSLMPNRYVPDLPA